jgi:hypothetical protein
MLFQMEFIMNSFTDRAKALVLYGIAGQPDREQWEVLIREAQNSGRDAYQNCTTIVQIAGTNEVSRSMVRTIAIDWYGAKAEAGDKEATELLFNFAKMAGDGELLSCFSTHYPESDLRKKVELACDVMPDAALTELGLDPETSLVRICRSPAPVLVYKPRG